jgi:predicted enzyme related to lactoylglutathione lyase
MMIARTASLLILLLATPAAAGDQPWVRSVQAPVYFAVDVGDVDAAVAWYGKVFGVRLLDDTTAEDGRWRIANMRNDSLSIEIIFDRRSKAPGKEERYRGFAKTGVAVPDVSAVADRVEKATGTRPRVIDFAKHGIRLIQLRDPENNVVQLHSPLKAPEADRSKKD